MTTTTLDETRAAWDRIAPGYDAYVTPTEVPLANEALGRVGLRSGMTFLDIAAGAGGLSLPAARLGARVTATDLSPVMVDRLLARAAEEGLDVRALVMDGHELGFADGSFDVVASQFGVMLFPDLPRALSASRPPPRSANRPRARSVRAYGSTRGSAIAAGDRASVC